MTGGRSSSSRQRRRRQQSSSKQRPQQTRSTPCCRGKARGDGASSRGRTAFERGVYDGIWCVRVCLWIYFFLKMLKSEGRIS